MIADGNDAGRAGLCAHSWSTCGRCRIGCSEGVSAMRIMALGLSLLLVSASEASAYIDPGSGSYLFQLLMAGGLAGIYTIRRYWHRLTGFFARRHDPPPHQRDGME